MRTSGFRRIESALAADIINVGRGLKHPPVGFAIGPVGFARQQCRARIETRFPESWRRESRRFAGQIELPLIRFRPPNPLARRERPQAMLIDTTGGLRRLPIAVSKRPKITHKTALRWPRNILPASKPNNDP
jgi:hypothetical protein